MIVELLARTGMRSSELRALTVDAVVDNQVARVAIDSPLFAGLEEQQTVWMNHGDSVKTPPPGARIIGSTGSNAVAVNDWRGHDV